jgi:hypothetical protein
VTLYSGTGPDIEEVRGPLEHTRHLRMALDLLQERLPPACACDGLESELWALREKIDAAELAQLRTVGHREYLVIQPLTPTAPARWSPGPPRPSRHSMTSDSSSA